ncbi:beta-ketoacyl synthase chain length factor [Luteimonas sp. 50]|uniref:Beta-ketoacyl synthase chain length factor n=1 Tax=Cognatiluteimonas sedimenti TaxID=2927791 RepID=A0ABT0A621_9GAMM|nr:beta-ketoacyl synthase chain length factor [Lysobacter sedimenti]MCJ0826435.1 beta-ketoacyl synthase chain length factor [Lysobacter sedimenti]
MTGTGTPRIDLGAGIEGIGFWANGLPDWPAARAFARGDAQPGDAPARPSPQLLAPNERRRAPDTVAIALEAALAACTAAGRDPATLPSVFASTHGDLGITDYMCATLASDPRAISPTRFHNSVHNAAAGYWTIGAGCHAPSTAISSFDASFAQGLLEALAQLAAGAEAVLLSAYDGHAAGPLAAVSPSQGLLAGALVLARTPRPGTPRLRATLVDAVAPPARGRLPQRLHGNAMAPMLPLFQALACGEDLVFLHAGPGRVLRVEIADA